MPRFLQAALLAAVVLHSATAPSQTTNCGPEQWATQWLRGRVLPAPLDITVAGFAAARVAGASMRADGKITRELPVYRFPARVSRVFTIPADANLHLVLADPAQPQLRVAATIPAAKCALGTGHENEFEYAALRARGLGRNALVQVTGVGVVNAAEGGARKTIVLSPLLSIRELAPPLQDRLTFAISDAADWLAGAFRGIVRKPQSATVGELEIPATAPVVGSVVGATIAAILVVVLLAVGGIIVLLRR